VKSMISRACRFVGRDSGQAAPEYALVLTLVAASCASLFAELGGRVTDVVQQVAGLLP
jgi:Flp pilus assembly pilin Flp